MNELTVDEYLKNRERYIGILAFATIPNKPVSENQLNKPAMTEEEQLEALYAELAKHPNIGNSSNDAPIDPATGEYMIPYESMRKVLGGNGSGTPDGLAPYAVAAFNFYTEDIAILPIPIYRLAILTQSSKMHYY
ncbi:hypothetical protein [Psychrobacillus sp. NPDC096389]|uniref:hypothetical protein n=1 Tax=Psychrobacillus sp. NPDC096389 TaxID=3364490 RepID=UPI003818ACBC